MREQEPPGARARGVATPGERNASPAHTGSLGGISASRRQARGSSVPSLWQTAAARAAAKTRFNLRAPRTIRAAGHVSERRQQAAPDAFGAFPILLFTKPRSCMLSG